MATPTSLFISCTVLRYRTVDITDVRKDYDRPNLRVIGPKKGGVFCPVAVFNEFECSGVSPLVRGATNKQYPGTITDLTASLIVLCVLSSDKSFYCHRCHWALNCVFQTSVTYPWNVHQMSMLILWERRFWLWGIALHYDGVYFLMFAFRNVLVVYCTFQAESLVIWSKRL